MMDEGTTRIKTIAASATIVIALMGLFAYLPGWRLIGSFRPEYIPMAPSTSLSFLIFSTAILSSEAYHKRIIHKIMFGLTVLATMFGLSEILGYFMTLDLNFEDQIVPRFGTLNGVPIARMSPSTGLFFLLIGLGTLSFYVSLIRRPKRIDAFLAGYTGTITLFGSLVFLLGYLFGRPLLYDEKTIPMALTTALGFLFLSITLIAVSGTNRFPRNVFQGPSTRARLMRIFVPLTMGAILSYSIISRFLDVFIDLNDALGVALFLVMFSAITAIAVERISRSIGDRLDRSEKRLQEAILRQNEAIMAGNVGLWDWDLRNNRVHYSAEWKSQIGYEDNEITDDFEEWRSRVHPDDLESTLEKVNQSIAQKRSGHKVEFRFRHKDGSYRWIAVQASILSDDEGRPIRMLGSHYDITERKKMEEELKEKSIFLDKVIESSALSTWISDENGTAIRVNPACLEFFGATEDEVVGKYNLFKDEVIQKMGFAKTVRNVFEKGKPESILLDYDFSEVNHVDAKNATHKVINSIFTPILDESGKVKHVIVQTIDLTDIKRMEAELNQARKMEAIGNLAGGIAHEFNNVLAIILGNAELAIDNVPDWNPAKESLTEIRKASFRAKEVVRQILSFARKTMTALKPIEINTVVKESLKLMRASIPAMVDIKPSIPAEPSMILGDPTEIHQIVINLCTNAAHAMKESGGTLEVSISEVALNERSASRYEDLSPGAFVKLTVRDSGEGISPDILEKVFEPYFTTKKFGAGSGMGLAVVYGLVKKCKGDINIKSTVGEGTTVEVLFPKIEAEAPAEEKKEGELPKGSERILLVDDDPSIVKMISQMLERLGYAVLSMTDSTEALEQLRSAPDDFDLVITDMAMPKMSGDALASELIKVRKDIPILLCTGHSDTVDEKKAKQMGIKGFAMKPLDTGKLARAVRAALDDR